MTRQGIDIALQYLALLISENKQCHHLEAVNTRKFQVRQHHRSKMVSVRTIYNRLYLTRLKINTVINVFTHYKGLELYFLQFVKAIKKLAH